MSAVRRRVQGWGKNACSGIYQLTHPLAEVDSCPRHQYALALCADFQSLFPDTRRLDFGLRLRYLEWARQYIDKLGLFPILSKYSRCCDRDTSLFQLYHFEAPIPSSN